MSPPAIPAHHTAARDAAKEMPCQECFPSVAVVVMWARQRALSCSSPVLQVVKGWLEHTRTVEYLGLPIASSKSTTVVPILVTWKILCNLRKVHSRGQGRGNQVESADAHITPGEAIAAGYCILLICKGTSLCISLKITWSSVTGHLLPANWLYPFFSLTVLTIELLWFNYAELGLKIQDIAQIVLQSTLLIQQRQQEGAHGCQTNPTSTTSWAITWKQDCCFLITQICCPGDFLDAWLFYFVFDFPFTLLANFFMACRRH